MPAFTLDDPRVRRILDTREVAILATVQPDGAPLAVAMWYVPVEDSLVMISVDGLRKVKNMRRDPRVSVVVEVKLGGASACVTLQGRSEFVDDPQQRRPLVEALFRKYESALRGRWSGREMPDDRVLFRIVPSRIFYWGPSD